MPDESKQRDVGAADHARSANETAEQAYVSSTDKDDLASATHNANIPVEDEPKPEGEVLEDVPQRYSESYGTGAQDPPRTR